MSQLERLKPGMKLLLAGPDMIVNFIGGSKAPARKFHSSNFDSMVSEYHAIHALFCSIVGSENLVIIDNRDSWNYEYQRQAQVYINEQFRTIPQVKIPGLHSRNYYYPRDAHTFLGNEMVVNTLSWGNDTDGYPLGSCLGEGGAVLSRGNYVIMSEELAEVEWYQLPALKAKDIKIGTVPSPAIGLPGNFARAHIDGHVALIEDIKGILTLLVAESYYQAAGARRQSITKAALLIGADKVVINDKNLPPLAFNLVQFHDGSVAMTSKADDLEEIIRELVGEKFIHTTRIPLVEFPNRAKSGLRCLSNEAPAYML